jgi:hypothetical protein
MTCRRAVSRLLPMSLEATMSSSNHTREPQDAPSSTPLNQEPGTAAPRDRESPPEYADERANEEAGNTGPEETPGFGQGA